MEEKKWWKEAVVYQIYPRSFKDSNGDGIGDINGIREKLDYLQTLGIDVIWLSPVYQSPNDDNGYDISDYQDIMTEFGSMADFDALIKEAHERNIRIVMDLVVNHSSDEHRWFIESKKSKDNPYRDYYIWKEGKDGKVPNNWGACFGGSAWEYDQATDSYYLHMFSKKQPDLNWENEKVRKEIFDMMTWWGEKGVDGFRMDVITMISKDQNYPDGKPIPNSPYGDFGPYVNNGPRVHEFLKEMNQKVISKFDWLTVGEGAGAGVEDAIKYAGFDRDELNMIFTFEHVNLGQSEYGKWSDGKVNLVELKKVLTKWQDGLEGKAWNSLYWDNHDQPRAVSRFGNDSPQYRQLSAKMLATCLHFMKGTPYIYQGEELGMTNCKCTSFDEFEDIEIKNAYRDYVSTGILSEEQMLSFVNAVGRDNARFPMQWDDTPNAGFTSGTPWIRVNDNYKEINAASQVKDSRSVFNYYKELIRLRHELPVMVYGVYEAVDIEHPKVFAYTRTLDKEKLFVICNFTEETLEYKLSQGFTGSEEILNSNYEDCHTHAGSIQLRPYEAKVFMKHI